VRRWFVLRALLPLVVVAIPGLAGGQTQCPSAALPAYAHNDYENVPPLLDALQLGYLGVEADVFLVEGTLRVGHDRKTARRAGSLETTYLDPLRKLASKCGTLTADGRPFMLNIELKETSRVAFDSLNALLNRYDDIIGASAGDSLRPIEVVLVGWHPPSAELGQQQLGVARLQYVLEKPEISPILADTSSLIRLISVDYGKTLGRWWVSAARRERWLGAFRAIKDAQPSRLVRVFNVPLDQAIYRRLHTAGVDLIGTKTLSLSRELLLRLP
jgi:hypothetical protein